MNSNMEQFTQLRLSGQPEIFLARWIADFPDADTFVHGLVHSEEGLWGRFVGEPALDELAEKGREEPDPAERHALYRQAEEHLQREALAVPFFHEQVYRFARPEVEGLQVGFSRPVVAYEKLWTKR
jgi:ABC-type oligopeptide transport system substrate-binding subunit